MSSTAAKVGILALVATAIAALAYYGKRTVNEWADKLSVKFISIGAPSLRTGLLSVPIAVEIQNDTPIGIAIDNLVIRLLRNNQVFGYTQNTGPFTVAVGKTPLTLHSSIQLSNIIPTGNVFQQVTNVLSNQSPLIDFVVEITTTVGGINLVVSKPQAFYLNDLINAR